MSNRPKYNLTLALLAALLAAAFGLHAIRARAMVITSPGSSTIQGSDVCSTTLGADSLLFYDGTNWCGATKITVPSGGMEFDDSGGTQYIKFDAASGQTDLAKKLTIQKGIDYAPNNVNDVTNTYAPRMVACTATFAAAPASGDDWGVIQTTQPITVDKIYTVNGDSSCSTYPTFEVTGDTHTVTLSSVIGGLTATSGFTVNVAAATTTQVHTTNSPACTTTNFKVCVEYYMQ